MITQARTGSISEKDMEEQLAEISAQELALKKEMGTIADLDLLAALDGWEEKAREYFADLQAGLEELNAVPLTDEERFEQFEIKRRVVNTLVEQVTILKTRELKITFRLNLLALAQRYFIVDQVPQVETYTRTSDWVTKVGYCFVYNTSKTLIRRLCCISETNL